MTIDIQPLIPDRLPDLAALFGEGGDPKWCWCAYYRLRGTDFSSGSAARNRAVLETATMDGVALGRAPGLIAYDEPGGRAIGWVSIGPRSDYERLVRSRVLAPVDDTPVWSIVCFVVSRRSRGHGLAHTLLRAAIDHARDHGAIAVEAYPAMVPDGVRVRSDHLFKGTLSMFERAGFAVVAQRSSSGGTAPRPIVRLDLTAPTDPG
jgi:GNAT superfamily N-acetyltransferase